MLHYKWSEDKKKLYIGSVLICSLHTTYVINLIHVKDCISGQVHKVEAGLSSAQDIAERIVEQYIKDLTS